MLAFLFHLWLLACAVGLVLMAFFAIVRIFSPIADHSAHQKPAMPLAPWSEVAPLMRVSIPRRLIPEGCRPQKR